MPIINNGCKSRPVLPDIEKYLNISQPTREARN
jgi:hypothetical protein